MRPSRIRPLAAVGVLALIALAPVAACAGEPLNPIPVQAAGAESAEPTGRPPGRPSTPASTAHSPPGAGEPTAARQPVRKQPVRTATTTTTTKGSEPPSSCHGAVQYDVDLQNTELALMTSMCFRAGAVLRLQGIGPGLVTSTPASLRSQSYEAGVVDIRFIRPGTVTVTIPQEEQTYTITVVVID
jgi:hypothetical protein